ncbi:MAG: fused MFS/spermidine synthase [Burkholderiaceae bacterium]
MKAGRAAPESAAGTPADSHEHVRPFVSETLDTRSLYFSISAIQSRMQVQHADALDLEYTRLMMGFLLFKPAPAQIGMIGLGGGSLVKFCHRHLLRSVLTVAEINPHVVALRDSFEVPADDARLRIITTDGAQLVRDASARFDVLLVDGFDREGLPKALRSQRFYDDCADVLQPGGLLVANLHHDRLHCDTYVERVRRSFAGAVLLVDDSDGSNRVVFAWKGELEPLLTAATIARRTGMSAAACAPLLPAFARVHSAMGLLRGAGAG